MAEAEGSRRADGILLVGCGQMGSAMLRGWLACAAAQHFIVIEPAGMPADLAAAASCTWHAQPEELGDSVRPAAVVFAVKPQVIDALLPSYRRWVGGETLFLSIAAGKTLAGLGRHLGAAAIVRGMPNTPAAIGRAITVCCANPQVAGAQRRLCDRLLSAIGETAWVEDEALMDPVTAVSGSGPAYVFLLIEALAEAGEKEGLPPELAQQLARATVAGAGELARIANTSPATLRENVTSPGGTTRAALDVLMAPDGLKPLLQRAVAAASSRSRELAG
ncbi:MAG: pyrroline-5-carboxylate reductase [Alphaproteobacteria bacterium]|nr:pyrroline-5-carboxylate reductase [Alphaproteobacteria bacterium]